MDGYIYLYGMIVYSSAYLLTDSYPKSDSYAEIERKFSFPGGETGCAATVLSSLGCKVKIDGTFSGAGTSPLIEEFFSKRSVDTSSLTTDSSFDGVRDMILVDRNTRTAFGQFAHFYSDSKKRWNAPDEKDIADAIVCGIDPFFYEDTDKAVELCIKHKKRYVTIDCPYDSYIAQNASVVAVSHEYLDTTYKNQDYKNIMKEYTHHCSGLIIFTQGSDEMLYSRKNNDIKTLDAFRVNTVSTLGAGDSFKAGCIYALSENMNDDETVRFAAAVAACAVTHFPAGAFPPDPKEINKLII